MKDLSIFINNLINALGRISCFLGSVKWILGRGLDQTMAHSCLCNAGVWLVVWQYCLLFWGYFTDDL